ncbi:SGNH/GDSL hydrolase family protein [Tautonia plasticadhaerens]|uniref:Multifunctional acyl-CoA thioesterase I and protease I and lysophospholipase L1 n=1 Tax=Tautonia plasticadhaerens TaxID=2527974 RepID=A0A518H5T2_9BACT|nr:GDSL-type esterase/lipase family protein [Tautonia plasticadhaerens]QDV36190.1 multifunctional acyl-CoA thioesterase I and protease I and lysophospholipase L1 [Tautonia plasticadhaerens]
MADLSGTGPRLCGLLITLGLIGSGPSATADDPAPRAARVVALGDSITRGVRPGVRPEDTFAALAERALEADGIAAEVVNLGIGGERTDQALERLDAVVELRPRVVTVMYGTNDSYVDPGSNSSRISREDYAANLRAIVAALRRRGITPILMTEPRWADNAPVNGLGESPNARLTPFMDACREVAAECGVPLVDHFSRWTAARADGQDLAEWTTDGCHPNPLGHRELAETLHPAIRNALVGRQSSFDR